MNPLGRRIGKMEMQRGARVDYGEPPKTWEAVYLRMINHVPRKRPPAPAVPMSPEEAYQTMINRDADPDEPTTPEESWRRYLERFA